MEGTTRKEEKTGDAPEHGVAIKGQKRQAARKQEVNEYLNSETSNYPGPRSTTTNQTHKPNKHKDTTT